MRNEHSKLVRVQTSVTQLCEFNLRRRTGTLGKCASLCRLAAARRHVTPAPRAWLHS